ncbi:MAG TPA: hypothetical protein VJ784_06090 [Pyrinomonadaceae bacterium]|nr:hypothetical protein [Pyrinomonadaceae bacterium]
MSDVAARWLILSHATSSKAHDERRGRPMVDSQPRHFVEGA